jgi:hypothetical protein
LSFNQKISAIGAKHLQSLHLARGQQSTHCFWLCLVRGFVLGARAIATRRRTAADREGRSRCCRRQSSIDRSCSSSKPIRTFVGNFSGRGISSIRICVIDRGRIYRIS